VHTACAVALAPHRSLYPLVHILKPDPNQAYVASGMVVFLEITPDIFLLFAFIAVTFVPVTQYCVGIAVCHHGR